MARKLLTSIVAVAALCVGAPAAAKPASPDAPRIAAAQKLLDSMQYDKLIARTLDAVVAETRRSIEANLTQELGGNLPSDLTTKILGIAEAHMRRAITDHRAELKRGTALIYARHFTTDELARLAALQADPVMAKMQAEAPQITAETMVLSRGLMDSAKAGVEDEVKAAVLDYLQRKKETPPS